MNAYNGFSPQQRNRAQAWLNAQWRDGALARPAVCCACGQEHGPIDAHAEDYSEPFAQGKTDEYHLCFLCHMMVHCRFRNRAAFDRYREAVVNGITFAPMGRNFPAFARAFLDDWAPRVARQGPPRTDDVLGRIASKDHHGRKAQDRPQAV